MVSLKVDFLFWHIRSREGYKRTKTFCSVGYVSGWVWQTMYSLPSHGFPYLFLPYYRLNLKPYFNSSLLSHYMEQASHILNISHTTVFSMSTCMPKRPWMLQRILGYVWGHKSLPCTSTSGITRSCSRVTRLKAGLRILLESQQTTEISIPARESFGRLALQSLLPPLTPTPPSPPPSVSGIS